MNHLILKTVINDMHEVIKEADIVDLQFTELSGRCSVFERPLSDAKRPLIFN